MKKRMLGLILLLALCLGITACATQKTAQYTQIGTSTYSIILPRGYAAVDDDFDEDQVAYYFKDNKSIDFDVYQWAKGDEHTLDGEAAYLAAEYGAVPEVIEINGNRGWKYVSRETYEGEEYTVVNYMFEDDISIIELCFWTDDSAEEYAAVEEIISTLTKQ